ETRTYDLHQDRRTHKDFARRKAAMTETAMHPGNRFNAHGLPEPQGLYHPSHEHDACGLGLIANIKGVKSHQIVQDALKILLHLEHRGAVGADPLAGDG